METLKFKTNIKCSGCVAQSTPFLNNAVGENNWQVDIQNPNKTLTITTNDTVSPDAIIKAVESAGFTAEKEA